MAEQKSTLIIPATEGPSDLRNIYRYPYFKFIDQQA